MPLHRDILWIGRQWAVTGFGMQAIDQKLGGRFDIEIARLWDENLTAGLREQTWFNAGDFEKGLAVARKRHPEPLGGMVGPPPEPPALLASIAQPPAPSLDAPEVHQIDPIALSEKVVEPIEPSFPEPLTVESTKPALPEFRARIVASGRFVRLWRARMKL